MVSEEERAHQYKAGIHNLGNKHQTESEPQATEFVPLEGKNVSFKFNFYGELFCPLLYNVSFVFKSMDSQILRLPFELESRMALYILLFKLF